MEEKLYGKLFNSVPIMDENHLELIINSMDNKNATYLLIEAITHAYHSGIFTLGESEVIAKCIRVLNKSIDLENK